MQRYATLAASFGTAVAIKQDESQKPLPGPPLPIELSVRGPKGELLTIRDLPDANTFWTPERKAVVVALMKGGVVSQDLLLARYGLSFEEFNRWHKQVASEGLAGLRATKEIFSPQEPTVLVDAETGEPMREFPFGDFTLYTKGHLRGGWITREGVSIHLTSNEATILRVLILKNGQPATRAHFFDYLYGKRVALGKTKLPDQKIIDVLICKLRKKLQGLATSACIKLVWGRGYKLVH